jgi:thiol-disulfide isomerase/thioredoxin
MKRTGLILFAAIFALVSGILAKNFWSSLESARPAPMPAFTLPDLAGKPHSSSEWRGKVMIINFWATWCPPCLKEIPEFMALQTEWAAKGVVFVGIALDDAQAVSDYNNDTPVNYPLLIAGVQGTNLAHEFGDSMDAVPFTVIVDRQGQIVHRQPGELAKAELLAIIAPLL